jgi:SARP family transcriptional regulator, regulator of embCAB operon
VRFEMLGPLRVVAESEAAPVGAPKVGTLLSVLLIRSGQATSSALLAHEIWGERPPRHYTGSIHVYIHNVRKILTGGGDPDPEGPDQRLSTRRDGYVLRTGPGELDVEDFRDLLGQGRALAAAGEHGQAARALARASALWRGPALDGLDGGPVLTEFVRWVTEARLECEALRVEEEFALGRYAEQIEALRELTAAHPFREDFTRQLMIALHRAGCVREALKTYREAAKLMRAELGLEPGPALRGLYAVLVEAGGSAVPRRAANRRPAEPAGRHPAARLAVTRSPLDRPVTGRP